MQKQTVNEDATSNMATVLQDTRYYLGQVEATLKKLEQSPSRAALPRQSPAEEVSVAYWKDRAFAAEGRMMVCEGRALTAEAELEKLNK